MNEFHIPAALRRELDAGDVVAFCGAGVSVSPGGLPSGKALAAKMSIQLGMQPGGEFTRIASHFETELGRQELIAFICRNIDLPSQGPILTHVQLPNTSFMGIVTTNWDELIERAFVDAGKAYSLVVRDEDIPFCRRGSIPLMKLHGTISQKDSLVVTERDCYEFLSRRPGMANMLRMWFMSKTILFVGYGLDDPNFKMLFFECRRVLGELGRRAYAVQLNPDRRTVADWDRDNVTILSCDAAAFLLQC